jgi:hypothetical protein
MAVKYKTIGVFFIRMFHDALLAPPDGRLLKRTLINFCLALCGSAALIGIAGGLLTWAGIPMETLDKPVIRINLLDFFGVVVFAPLVETLLLAGLLALTPRRWGIVPRAIVSAIVWGGLHALSAPFWFLGTAFSFFVFSCGYLVWRQKSFKYGFAAAAMLHALINLTAFIAAALST